MRPTNILRTIATVALIPWRLIDHRPSAPRSDSGTSSSFFGRVERGGDDQPLLGRYSRRGVRGLALGTEVRPGSGFVTWSKPGPVKERCEPLGMRGRY